MHVLHERPPVPNDIALRDFFTEILGHRQQAVVLVLAPDSTSLVERWRAIAPTATRIRALPGLPEALQHDWTRST